MLTTAGAARSTASAYEFTARGVSTAGWAAGAEATGAGEFAGGVTAGAGGFGAGMRRAMSSGRTITAMNAAARPTIAERAMNVTIRRTGEST